jgi:hypothetical protein
LTARLLLSYVHRELSVGKRTYVARGMYVFEQVAVFVSGYKQTSLLRTRVSTVHVNFLILPIVHCQTMLTSLLVLITYNCGKCLACQADTFVNLTPVE